MDFCSCKLSKVKNMRECVATPLGANICLLQETNLGFIEDLIGEGES